MSGREDPPMTVEHLKEMAYDYYTDFYEKPQRISYFELSNQVGAQNVRVLDYVAAALDLGCEDAQEDHEKRTKEELLEYIGRPDDDRWDLVAGEDNE